MFHAFDWTYAAPRTLLAERLVEHAASVQNYQDRFLSVLKSTTSISEEVLKGLNMFHQATIIEPDCSRSQGSGDPARVPACQYGLLAF
jgi:hypothetical protein